MRLSTKTILAVALVCSSCTVGGGSPGASRRTASTTTSTSTSTNTNVTGATRTVTISWNANREKAVNSAGGGYRVYYSSVNNFSIGSASALGAAYVSGATAPTSVTTPALGSGTYYYRVVAYSTLNPAGALSAQQSFVIP